MIGWVFTGCLPKTDAADFCKALDGVIADEPTRDALRSITAMRECCRKTMAIDAIEKYIPHLLGLIRVMNAAPDEIRRLIAVSWTLPFTSRSSAVAFPVLQFDFAMWLLTMGMLHRKAARDAFFTNDGDAAIKRLLCAAGVFGCASALTLPSDRIPQGVHELKPEFSKLMQTLCVLEAQQIVGRSATGPATVSKVYMYASAKAELCRRLIANMLDLAAEYRFAVLDAYLAVTGQLARGKTCLALAEQMRSTGGAGVGHAIGLLKLALPASERGEKTAYSDVKSQEHMSEFLAMANKFNEEKIGPALRSVTRENETVYFANVPSPGDISLPAGSCVVADDLLPYAEPRPADVRLTLLSRGTTTRSGFVEYLHGVFSNEHGDQ
jgi:hypothetical protein